MKQPTAPRDATVMDDVIRCSGLVPRNLRSRTLKASFRSRSISRVRLNRTFYAKSRVNSISRFLSPYPSYIQDLNLRPSTHTRSPQLVRHPLNPTMAKRKCSTVVVEKPFKEVAYADGYMSPAKRGASGRRASQPKHKPPSNNPNENANVLDAPGPLRASPGAEEEDEKWTSRALGWT